MDLTAFPRRPARTRRFSLGVPARPDVFPDRERVRSSRPGAARIRSAACDFLPEVFGVPARIEQENSAND
jgi:hypothetical protein